MSPPPGSTEKAVLEAARDTLTNTHRALDRDVRDALDKVRDALAQIERREAEAARATDPVLNDPVAVALVRDFAAALAKFEGMEVLKNSAWPESAHLKGCRAIAMDPAQRVAVVHVPPGTPIHLAKASAFGHDLMRLAFSAVGDRRVLIASPWEGPNAPIGLILADAPYAVIVAPRIEWDAREHPGHDGHVTTPKEVMPVAGVADTSTADGYCPG